ncbi:MAG: hypothetical protein AB7S26_14410 [Sandaracinaceae bacterium]
MRGARNGAALGAGLRIACLVLVGCAAWTPLALSAQTRGEVPTEGIRGVTVGPIESSLFPGRGYGTPSSAALLDFLARQGVTWVSVTPFGRIWSLTSTTITMDFEAPYEDNRVAVRTFVAQAHERGIQVLIIPHLWVETTGWRGEIDPGEGWPAYLESYRSFVLAWARDAELAGADAFSIGVECKSFSGRFGAFWRVLIADVRASFGGWLTYSANWDEAADVLFWDQLDAIGINAFYPLADHDEASFGEYLDGAAQAATQVRELSEILSMPVLFVEVGYTTRANAAVQPWLWPDGMSDVVIDEREQARALLASLRTFLPERWFLGFFVWRYYADLDDVSQEAVWGFSPHGKLAEPMLARIYAAAWGTDPEPYEWLKHAAPPPLRLSDVVLDVAMRTRSTVLPRY